MNAEQQHRAEIARQRKESVLAWLHDGHRAIHVGQFKAHRDSRIVDIWERDGRPVIIVTFSDANNSFDIFVQASSSNSIQQSFDDADARLKAL